MHEKDAADTNTMSNLKIEIHKANHTVDLTKQQIVAKNATTSETIAELSDHVKHNTETIEVLQNDKASLHELCRNLTNQISNLKSEVIKY